MPTFADYRPLSLSALVSLLLGLASAVVLINPVFAMVPLAAIVLAVIALRGIATASGGLSGRRLAVAGLCLAALFLGWGLAKHFHHQAHLSVRAREFADDWLRVLSAGDLPRAFQLHVRRESRQDPHSIRPRMTMTQGEPDFEMTEFFDDPALEVFLAAGPNVRYRFEEVVLQTQDGLSDRVVLKYTFESDSGRLPLWITVRRTFGNSDRQADWEIYSARHVPPGQ
ncbi:MAG TPA: hypothetical protein VMP01_01575 [Pirellulaceae bacterium]|nr:hypothetical protein [Pirellulaceae bacterium]